MTLYADRETRETWRINYLIPNLESSQSAFRFWERIGGVMPGCVLALAHAIEQIDADEDLMRQALRSLVELLYANPVPSVPEIEYSVLYEFAKRKRCSYNDLCKAVREAVEAPIRVRTMLAAAKEES